MTRSTENVLTGVAFVVGCLLLAHALTAQHVALVSFAIGFWLVVFVVLRWAVR